MTLTDQIAQLWAASTPPAALPTEPAPIGLPKLPRPLGCPLDHHDPDNWQYAADKYGRTAQNNLHWRRVTCKSCGRFWGYAKNP